MSFTEELAKRKVELAEQEKEWVRSCAVSIAKRFKDKCFYAADEGNTSCVDYAKSVNYEIIYCSPQSIEMYGRRVHVKKTSFNGTHLPLEAKELFLAVLSKEIEKMGFDWFDIKEEQADVKESKKVYDFWKSFIKGIDEYTYRDYYVASVTVFEISASWTLSK